MARENLILFLCLGVKGGHCGGGVFYEKAQLLNQDTNIHAVHQSPIFQSIESNGEATGAAHIKTRKKLHRIWVTVNNLFDFRVPADHHNVILPLPTLSTYASIYRQSAQYILLGERHV